MKLVAVLLATLTVVGCASSRPTIPYQQIQQFKASSADCPQTDQIISNLNASLARYGILDKNPEDMTETQRQYNERAKIIKWSLIIGCNNPNRYSQ